MIVRNWIAQNRSFTPAKLPNITRWWDSYHLIESNNSISQLTDILGNGDATNANAATQPELITFLTYLKNIPSLRFANNAVHVLNFTNVDITNFTIHIVYFPKSMTNGVCNILYGQSDATLKGGVWAGGSNANINGLGVIDKGLSRIRQSNNETVAFNIASITNNKIYINNAEVTYTNTNDILGLILSKIGSRPGANETTFFYQGYIFEIAICNAINTLPDITNFYNYAYNKYLGLIRTPSSSYEELDKHIEMQTDNYWFGFNNTQVYCSSDYGENWTIKSFEDADLIESGIIFSNGNIFFTVRNKCYRSLDLLQTITEVTVLDKDGNTYSAPDPTGIYYKKSTIIQIWNIDGVDVCIWGNYGNVVGGNVPTNIYRMYNDCIPKVTYTFGVNPAYPGVGDPLNPIICRHGHNLTWNNDDEEIYMTTGDFAPACPWMKCVYNIGSDTFTWSLIVNSPTTVYACNWAGIFYESTSKFLYFADDTYGTVYRCKPFDLEISANHEVLFTHIGGVIYNLILKSDGTGIAVGQRYILVTQNHFVTYSQFEISGYIDPFLKLSEVSQNLYKVEKYISPVHNSNSIYVTLIPNS